MRFIFSVADRYYIEGTIHVLSDLRQHGERMGDNELIIWYNLSLMIKFRERRRRKKIEFESL